MRGCDNSKIHISSNFIMSILRSNHTTHCYVCISIPSCLNSVLRYKFLILDTYQPDTQYLRQQGREDPWLFLERKGVRKHCFKLTLNTKPEPTSSDGTALSCSGPSGVHDIPRALKKPTTPSYESKDILQPSGKGSCEVRLMPIPSEVRISGSVVEGNYYAICDQSSWPNVVLL